MPNPFWQQAPEEVLQNLGTSENGLSNAMAASRLANRRKADKYQPEWLDILRLFVRQFASPLVLLLVFAAILSASMSDWSNAIILISILFLTGSISFWQEYRASKAVQKLQAMMHIHCNVMRAGKLKRVLKVAVVPGDIVLLSAGDVVPGDCLLLESTDLHANESALTGESFPAEKEPGISDADASLSERKNVLFEGSSVMSGSGKVVVVLAGGETEFGKISAQMGQAEPETSFQSGIRKFGYLLLRMTFVLSAGILIFNLFLGKPIAASILFSIALAVGLAPELLPAIMVTTLSAGAIRMARDKVIVKRLDAIQNLGAINILCSDKTGTLTTGEASVAGTLGFDGQTNDRVRLFAWLNAYFETGFTNPLDEAIRKMTGMEVGSYSKKDEVPYDFLRKRLSVVVYDGAKELMITKGALAEVLSVCNRVEMPDGSLVDIESVRKEAMQQFETQSAQGFRTIGIAWKDVTGDPLINKDDETEMVFLGFLLLEDPPRSDIADTLQSLEDLGITLKIITGDNHLAAAHLARTIGIDAQKLLTGHDISILGDAALARKVHSVNLFAEVEPQQKERLIRALRANGNVVGYLGDGINDAPALKAADVGISVDSAVDVAKEAADIVLMEKNLEVLKKGILDGRKTYVNTLKYIFITTSANFGNMFSLAGISLFLPWLPLLPAQILMLNFLSDVPALTIASDNVDDEQLSRPKHWDIALIRRFMVVFGIQSSLFDYLTFGCLLLIFKASETTFQTGWFIESVLTEIMVLLIIRTVRPALKSRPSRWLLGASIATVAFTLLLPYLPLGRKVGLEPLPMSLLGFMIGIAILYSFIVESTKRRFFRKAAL